jgi:hypothetical protein
MENKTELYKALAAFQQKVPTIHKAKEGYGYSYAELSTILEIINPIMSEFGLGFTQLLNGDNLKTIVFHAESGQSIESETQIPKVSLKGMNDYQAFGSGITYFRRYCLSAILGLVTDKDTDAHGDQKKPETPPAKTPAPAVKTAPEPKKKVETEEQFTKVVEWVQSGKGTLDKAKSMYDFTAVQLDDLQAILNQK